MGNLDEEPLEAIWKGARFRTFRKMLTSITPPPVCRECFVRGWKEAPQPGLLSSLGNVAGVARARLLGVGAPAAEPRLFLNAGCYRTGDDLAIGLGLRVRNKQVCPRLDVYVYARPLQDVAKIFIRMEGRFAYFGGDPVPVLSGQEPFDFERFELFCIPLPTITVGAWELVAAVTPHGHAFADEAQWLGSSRVGFAFEDA